jgi:hypothetical protein
MWASVSARQRRQRRGGLTETTGERLLADRQGVDTFRSGRHRRARVLEGPAHRAVVLPPRSSKSRPARPPPLIGDDRTHYFDERAGWPRCASSHAQRVRAAPTRVHANHYAFGGLTTPYQPAPTCPRARTCTARGSAPRRASSIARSPGCASPPAERRSIHPFRLEGHDRGRPRDPDDGVYLDEHAVHVRRRPTRCSRPRPPSGSASPAGIRVDVYSTFGAIVVPRGALIFKPTKGGVAQADGRPRVPRAQHLRAVLHRRRQTQVKAAVDPERGLTLRPRVGRLGRGRVLPALPRGLGRARRGATSSFMENIINTIDRRVRRGGPRPLRQQRRARASRWAESSSSGESGARAGCSPPSYGYQRAQYLDSRPCPAGQPAADQRTPAPRLGPRLSSRSSPRSPRSGCARRSRRRGASASRATR